MTLLHIAHVLQGKKSLHYAVRKEHNKMVPLLLQHNPDNAAKDPEVCSTAV